MARGTSTMKWLWALPLLAALQQPAPAIDSCKGKVDKDGTIFVDARGVQGGVILWGEEAGLEANTFFNEATCLAQGDAKKCVLGDVGTEERIMPPRLCTIHLVDGGPDGCGVRLKGCTPGLREAGTNDLEDGSVTNPKLGADAVTTDKLQDGAVTAADLAPDSVGAVHIQTGAVTSSEILDGTITAADLAADSVGAAEIQTGAVGSSEIADGGIAANDLAVNSVGAAQIAAGAVGTSEVVDGSLTPTDMTFTTQHIEMGLSTTATKGAITKNGAPFLHNAGTRSTFVGLEAGNFTTLGSDNTGVGRSALKDLTTGSGNTGVGKSALENLTTAMGNTAVGDGALDSLTAGDSNVAIGRFAGGALTSGQENVYVAADAGAASESDTIRVGTQGTQTRAFLAGVKGTPLAGSPVVVTGAGQLGEGTFSPMITACPSNLGLNDKSYVLPAVGGEQTRICASAIITKSTPRDTLPQILETPIKQACLALINLSTLQLNTFASIFPEIAAALLDALREPIETAVNDVLGALASSLNTVLNEVKDVVDDLNGIIGMFNDFFEEVDDLTPGFNFTAIDLLSFPFGTGFSLSVSIPAVSASTLSAIVEDALANHPLFLLTGVLTEEVCGDETQLDVLIDQVLEAFNYLLVDVPGGAAIADTTTFPRYAEAQLECAKRGAHICTMGELDLLTRSVAGGTVSGVLGYTGGEWVGGTGGDGVLFGDPDAGYVADWPPIEVDLQNLMQFPPGLPFAFKLPTIPTGKFRCCLSASPVI